MHLRAILLSGNMGKKRYYIIIKKIVVLVIVLLDLGFSKAAVMYRISVQK